MVTGRIAQLIIAGVLAETGINFKFDDLWIEISDEVEDPAIVHELIKSEQSIDQVRMTFVGYQRFRIDSLEIDPI